MAAVRFVADAVGSVDQVSGLGCPVTIGNGQYNQRRLEAVAEASQMHPKRDSHLLEGAQIHSRGAFAGRVPTPPAKPNTVPGERSPRLWAGSNAKSSGSRRRSRPSTTASRMRTREATTRTLPMMSDSRLHGENCRS